MLKNVFHTNACFLIGVVFLLLMVVSTPAHAVPWEESVEYFLGKNDDDRLLMLFFYTEWHTLCQRMDAYTFTDERVEVIERNFHSIKVNLGDKKRPINEKVRKRYNITDLPTVVFINVDGGLIKKYTGYASAEQLATIMEEVLIKEANFKNALKKLKKIPNDAALNRQIALAYLERKQFEKALTLSKKIPDDPKLNGHIALAYLAQDQLEKARIYGDKVFEKDPENSTNLQAKLHFELGVYYIDQGYIPLMDWRKREDLGNFQKATEHFQTIIDVYPTSDVYELAHFYLGVIYAFNSSALETIGWIEKSVEIFEKLIKLTVNEKMKFQTESMIERVKYLEYAYNKSIITIDYACNSIKILADVVKDDN